LQRNENAKDFAKPRRAGLRKREMEGAMTEPRPDAFSIAITSGAISALRKRAQAARDRASTARASEAAVARRIALALDQIADDLEGEGRR
jgi:hypothetical protein